MKRLIIALILLCFIVPPCFADTIMIAKKKAGGGGGPDAWYGPSHVTVGGWVNNTTVVCEDVTFTSAGTNTLLRAFIHDQAGSAFKMARYNADGSSLLASCEVSWPWTDDTYTQCNVADVATSAATVYRICILSDNDIQYGLGAASGGTAWYKGGMTYSSFPPATMTGMSEADDKIEVGGYVD